MMWVRNLPFLKPSTAHPLSYEDLTFSHLMSLGSISRDHIVVRSLFNHSDAIIILATLVYSQPIKDSRVWKATIDDSDTVKSVYIICINLLHYFVPSNNSHWKLLWNHKAPRVCAFQWRTVLQCLPTEVNLSNCGVPCNKSCVTCELSAESHMHIFFVCSNVVECWDRIGIRNIIRDMLLRTNNFYVMLFDLFYRLKEQGRPLAVMILCSF